MPILARIATKPAKKAEEKAKKIHIKNLVRIYIFPVV
jgi:hypothetical protein